MQLAVIYGEPSDRFVTNEHAATPPPSRGAAGTCAGTGTGTGTGTTSTTSSSTADVSDEQRFLRPAEDDAVPPETGVLTGPALPPPSPMDDLLGLMDELPSCEPAPAPLLRLAPNSTLDAPTFQQQWDALPVSDTWSSRSTPGTADSLLGRLATHDIKCMAFGSVDDVTKFYFFALELSTQTVLLIELQIHKDSGVTNGTIKASSPQPVAALSALLKGVLEGGDLA